MMTMEISSVNERNNNDGFIWFVGTTSQIQQMFEWLQRLGQKHEDLKKRIHSFRMPLSPLGQRVMGLVYFSIPVVGGYFVMQMAIGRAEVNLEKSKEKMLKSNSASKQNEALGELLTSIKNSK